MKETRKKQILSANFYKVILISQTFYNAEKYQNFKSYNRTPPKQMGNFLKTIPVQQTQRPQRLFFSKYTLSKLREYHGVFKSLCDTFSIDDSQFCQIFGSGSSPPSSNASSSSLLDSVFCLLDDDNNLLIDGLELFCGLILFSQSSCHEKISFLFDLFDFNGFNSLSTTDLEFLFLSCCSAAHKILGLKSPLPEAEIRDMVTEQFPANKRINISEMLKWATQMEYVKKLFEIIGKSLPKAEGLFSKKVYCGRGRVSGGGYSGEVYRKSKASQDRKLQQWICSLSKRLRDQSDRKAQEVNLQLEWAYGIRCLDIKQSLQLTTLQGKQVLIYPTACLVVISFLRMNRQCHYRKHENPVMSLTAHHAPSRTLIASGQLGSSPAIHLWQLGSLCTLYIIKSLHKLGVSMLKFSCDGGTLVSAGLQQESALYLHSVQTSELRYSTYVNEPVVEISNIVDYTEEDRREEIIVCTTREVVGFKRGDMENLVKWGSGVSDATCCCSLKYYINNRYLKSHQEVGSSACAILTGHQKGELILWEHQLDNEYTNTTLKTYPSEVIKIEAGPETIIVGSFCSYIDIWSIEFKLMKTIDLTSLGVKFLSYEAINFAGDPNGLVVLTKQGDIVRLKTNPSEPDKPVKPTRILNVVKNRGRQKCACLLQNSTQTTIYTGGQTGIIYGLNSHTHEMVDVWNLGEPISALDVIPSTKGGSILCAGTHLGRIYLRVDLQEIEKNYECSKIINDVKLINSGTTIIAACQDRYVYILTNSTNNYFSNSRKIDLDSTVPKSIQFVDGKVLVATAQRKLYLLSLSDYKYKLLDTNTTASKQVVFSGSRPIAVRYVERSGLGDKDKQDKDGRVEMQLPVVLTNKILLMGSAAGGLCFSRESVSLANRVKAHIGHHRCNINDILVSEDYSHVYTLGDDCTILSYRLRFLGESQLLKTPQTICKQTYNYDEIMEREIAYCLYTNNTLDIDHDQHLLVRGIKNPTLSKLLRGVMDEWKQTKEPKTSLNKHTPPVNLSLDYVYGIQTFERRDSVMYVTDPKRFLYYVSRIVVLYNPQTNQQQFYKAHRAKITCLAVLDGRLAASGEAAFNPCVNIWNYDTLKTVRVIKSGHQWGITHLFGQGDMLLTCGIEQKLSSEQKQSLTYSLQLSSIWTSQTLSFKKQPPLPIYSLCFDPFDPSRFVTTGEGVVVFWQSNSLTIHKQSICFTDEETITCCATYQYEINGRDCFDVVVGTKTGKLAVISQKKYFMVMRDKAHTKWINLVKWAAGVKEQIFVTAAEDEYIKIWNKRFECIYEQEIRKIDFFKEITKMNSDNKYFEKASFQRNLSVQSVSVWPNSKDLVLLLATRNGQVIQLSLTPSYTESKYSLYLRNHCSQNTQTQPHKRIFFALHPRFDIMLSLGEDQNLFVWDTEKNKLITSKILGYVAYPTAVKFNKDGDILVIGFSDGLVIFLDSKIIKSNQGKNDQKFITPTLSLITKYKQDKKAAVLNIEFSDSGEHLAVSFNNSSSDKIKYDPSISNETSWITLFINRSKNKLKVLSKSQPSDKVYEWFTDVRCQQGEKVYQTLHNNIYGMACYFMSFAEAEGKTYLLIYYQLVDSNNIRLNHMTQSDYIVWDVNTSTIVVNLDLISHIPWKRLNFPNSINCQYQLYNDLAEGGTMLLPAGDTPPRNNNMLKPQICSMWNVREGESGSKDSLGNFLLLGSLNGDIHIVQTRALEYAQPFSHSPTENEMYLARTYAGHLSFVNHMQVSQENGMASYLHTSGVEDQCLMKWKINSEFEVVHTEEGRDIFGDVPMEAVFQTNLELYKQRELVADVSPPLNSAQPSPLQLHFVIGRRSATGRNSLFFDCRDNAVYPSGRNILKLNLTNSKQTVLYCDEGGLGPHTNSASQIGAICITADRRTVAVGTNSTQAMLILWQVSSKICLRIMKFPELVSILLLQFAENNRHLILYGLQIDGTGRLHLVDSASQCVLATVRMKFEISWMIKGMSFLSQTFESFITCGVNHLRMWTYIGNQLAYQNIPLGEKQQSKKYIVLFSIISVGRYGYVTCCDSGYVYLFSLNHKIVSKVKGHQGLCLALAKEKTDSIAMNGSGLGNGGVEQIRVVSGGKDGRVVLWKLENERIIQVLSYDLNTLLGSSYPLSQPKLLLYREIQSVNLSSNSILVGARNGSIYHLLLDTIKNEQQVGSVKQVLHLHDFQPSVGMFFSENHLYEITRSGLLTVWDVTTNKCVAFRDFDSFIVDLIPCMRAGVYFVVMELEVVAIKIADFKFALLESFCTNFSCRIMSAAITRNQKMLAISVDRSAESKSRVLVYDISGNSFKQLYSTFLTQNPQYLDFSSNNRVLLCKNPDKDIQIDTNIWSEQPPTSNQKHRWIGQGLKDDTRLSQILKQYSQQKGNKVLRVVEFSQDNYVFTDAIGTLRVYSKPSNQPLSLLQVSKQHLNTIHCCVKSKKYIATASQCDRSIVVWRIAGEE